MPTTRRITNVRAAHITSLRRVLIAACSDDVQTLLRTHLHSEVGRACSTLIESASVTLALIDETDLRDEMCGIVAHQCDVWLFG